MWGNLVHRRRCTPRLSRAWAALCFCFWCSLGLSSCSFFETRTPEDPSGSSSSFQQPTSELIVLSNFQAAIRENNSENFVRCLADTTQGAKNSFHFDPSSDAQASYSEQFRSWSVNNERQAFSTMVAKLSPSSHCDIQVFDGHFEIRVPDSAVYLADYILTVPHTSASIPKVVAGNMRLTIVPNVLNQWSIERWIDSKSVSNDSIPLTWSSLKAQFSN